MEMKTTFIYGLIDPRTREVRYIGKANQPGKRYYQHLNETFNSYKCNWVKSLKEKGFKPQLEIIDEVSETEWSFWEQHYISLYRSWGFRLTNNTDGGEGMFNPSDATRLKMSLAKLGKPGSKKGHKASEETRERNRLANLGKTKSEETKEKMKSVRKGKTFVELFGEERAKEIKENSSKADRPQKFKKGQTPWNKGKSHSPESIEKMRQAKLKNK